MKSHRQAVWRYCSWRRARSAHHRAKDAALRPFTRKRGRGLGPHHRCMGPTCPRSSIYRPPGPERRKASSRSRASSRSSPPALVTGGRSTFARGATRTSMAAQTGRSVRCAPITIAPLSSGMAIRYRLRSASSDTSITPTTSCIAYRCGSWTMASSGLRDAPAGTTASRALLRSSISGRVASTAPRLHPRPRLHGSGCARGLADASTRAGASRDAWSPGKP